MNLIILLTCFFIVYYYCKKNSITDGVFSLTFFQAVILAPVAARIVIGCLITWKLIPL